MAAYQSNLLGDYFRRSSQRRALTGLPMSYQEQRGMLDPILNYDAGKARDAGLLANQKSQFDRQLSLQEKAQNSQKMAGIVGGVGQLAMLPMAYDSAKNMGWLGGAKAAPASAPGLMSTAPAVATTAQGAVAPAVAGGTAQGMASAAYPGIAGTASPAAVGPMSAVGGEAAGAGLLGTAGAVALPAAAGAMAGGLLGGPVSKMLDTHPKTTKDVMSIGGGIAAGAAYGSTLGPGGTLVGGVVGGIIGAVSALF